MRKSAPLFCALLLSLSARRAWIEIGPRRFWLARPRVALRKESVDRNGLVHEPGRIEKASLSARRAWIEIPAATRERKTPPVALRKESVDRNFKLARVSAILLTVALRKESVDRNHKVSGILFVAVVALRKESVDRNISRLGILHGGTGRSPQGERG